MKRLVVEGVATQREVLEEMSFEDVWDYHEILDAKQEAAIKAGRPKKR